MTEEASQDTTSAPLRFQSGGAVRPGAFYIERDADAELLQTLLDSEYCYVLAPRQMGKSSLRVRAGEQLRKHGVRYATVDLQSIGSGKDIKINDWYYSVIDTLNSSLGLNCDLTAFWTGQGQHLTDPDAVGRSTLSHSWATFLQREVLAHTTEPIVIFVDEIDSVLSLPFSTDDFFAAIRSAHESRPEHPEYNRLTFCLMGVAAPNDLIRDTTRTPFNIGKSISLDDFTWPQTQKFLDGLSNVNGNSNEYLRAVFSWANGQPYMTHKLCQEIAKLDGQSSGQSEVQVVRKLVETIFLQRGRTQDSNLRYAEDRFDQISSPSTKSQLLQLYRQLLHGQNVEVKTDNPAQSELKLTGLAAERHDGKGVILQRRNEIFATVFDDKWIREKEGERLFHEALTKWLEAHARDANGEEYLLRGEALEEGLAWWRQRNDVTKEEQEFLLASQELVRKKAMAEARWAKRLKTLSGLLGVALVAALIFALLALKNGADARNKNQQLIASEAELNQTNDDLKRGSKALQESQDELQKTNIALKREKDAADQARRLAENAKQDALKIAEEIRTANSALKTARAAAESARDEAKAAQQVALDRARELEVVASQLEQARLSATVSLKRAYFAMGNRELEDRQPVRSSVYYAASLDLPKEPDDRDSQIRSKLELTAQLAKPLVDGLIDARISPDGKRMISIARNETVQLWDLNSGKGQLLNIGSGTGDSTIPPALPVNPWSPDSRRVIISVLGNIKLWNTETGAFVADLPEIGGSRLDWSDDGKRLVSLGNGLVLWDAKSGRQVRKLLDHLPPYAPVAWTENGKRLAAFDPNGIVQLWDSEKGASTSQLKERFSVEQPVLFNSSIIGMKQRLVTTSSKGLAIWNAHDGSLQAQLSANQIITQLVVSQESIIALDQGKIRWWTEDGSLITELPGEFVEFSTMGMGESRRLISTDVNGNKTLWNARTGKSITTLPTPSQGYIIVLGNRDRFAISNDKGVQLWDSIAGKPLLMDPLPVQLLDQTKLMWSDNDQLLVIQNRGSLNTGEDGSARVWDAQTGKPLAFVPWLQGFNNLMQLSWTSQRLITSDQTFRSFQLWKLRFTPPSLEELIENVRNSGCKMVEEEVQCQTDGTPLP
jgi:WD40 repeat protein